MRYPNDDRIKKPFTYFLNTQQKDGGWKCDKHSFGRGKGTEYLAPCTTLIVLDLLHYSPYFNRDARLDKTVDFLLEHWNIRRPISPCHCGINTLFMQIEYPFWGYSLFYYMYVLSFYDSTKEDGCFLEALKALGDETVNEKIPMERVVPKLARLDFCKEGKASELTTIHYQEILKNIRRKG